MNTEGSRLQDPTLALSIWQQMKTDDEHASQQRAQVDAMVNGEEPFDPEVLAETGQADAANFNLRESALMVSQECSAYEDLISGRSLITVRCTEGDMATRTRHEGIIATEFSRLIRSWDGFRYWYNLMVRQRVTHGLGVFFFTDETDFRPKSCGWCDFKLPRDTPALESAINIATILLPMDLSTLNEALTASEETDSPLWNRKLLKELIQEESGKILSYNTNRMDSWEYIEKTLKENSVYFGSNQSSKVWVVHFFITEADGSVSHGYLLETNQPNPGAQDKSTEWLYFNKSRYKSINEALITFPYDNTISGTYHAIRGRGWIIQPQVITNTALACRMADGAMSATMNLLQVKNASQTDLDRLSVAHFGNNELLPPGVDYIDRKPIDVTRAVLPVMEWLENVLRKNNTGAKPQIPALDKNAPAIAHQLEAQNNAALSASALNQFYTQLDKLFWQMFRRATASDYEEGDPGWELVETFRKRLTDKGIDQKILDKVEEVTARRVVGAGSAANRILTLQRLEQRQGAFDPEGRHNLTFDIVAEEVGEDSAERYMSPTLMETQRQPVDTSIAMFETFMFESRKPVQVLPNQDHFVHVSQHLPPLAAMMDQLEQLGERVEIEQLINTHEVLMTALPHIATHTNYMAGDRARQKEVKGIIQMSQQLAAADERLINQITRLQEAQAEAEAAEQERQQQEFAAYVKDLEAKAQQGGPEASGAQAKIIEAQVKARISEAEHQQKLIHREREFNQARALKDAANAAEMIRKAERMATEASNQTIDV
jgi:hypothetical protein